MKKRRPESERERERERSGRRRAARSVDICGREERRLWKRTQMGAGSDKTFLTPRDGRPGVCLRKDPSRARGEEGGEEWRAEGRGERVKGTGGTVVGRGERSEGRGGLRSHLGSSFHFLFDVERRG